tara:strand:- start:40 stop:534 length:495 start_codon:yes stop_codon:yes gene_type:complete
MDAYEMDAAFGELLYAHFKSELASLGMPNDENMRKWTDMMVKAEEREINPWTLSSVQDWARRMNLEKRVKEKAIEWYQAIAAEQHRSQMYQVEIEALRRELVAAKGAAAIRTPRASAGGKPSMSIKRLGGKKRKTNKKHKKSKKRTLRSKKIKNKKSKRNKRRR